MKAQNYLRSERKENSVALLFILFCAVVMLIYLACIAYVIIDFMNRPSVQPHDVVTGYIGFRLHKRIWPVLRKQVFVRR